MQPGDELLYEIIDGQVILTKARRGATTERPVPHLRGMGIGSGHQGLCRPLNQVTLSRFRSPYTDSATRQSRPALVVSTARLQDLHGLLWVVMITSAENRGWPDDIPVADLKMAGLPVPSLIRSAKIATIDASAASKAGAGDGEVRSDWSRGSSSRGWGPHERRAV